MGLAHTHKTYRLAAKVASDKSGVKFIQYTSESYLRHCLNLMRVSDQLTVSITTKKPNRTISQNNFYWGAYLPLIAKETGEEDVDALHELFKGMFLTKTIKEVLGRKVRIKGSTSNLSVSEFCDYILEIEKLTGVIAPPTENFHLEPLIRSTTSVLEEQTIE